MSLMPMQVQRSLLPKHANNLSLSQNVWYPLRQNARLTSAFQFCIDIDQYGFQSKCQRSGILVLIKKNCTFLCAELLMGNVPVSSMFTHFY